MKFNFKSLFILIATVAVIVFVRSKSQKVSPWHQTSLIGFHTHIELTWKDPHHSTEFLMEKIDSLVREFDTLFTETHPNHPFQLLSQGKKATPLYLTGKVKKVFDYLENQKQRHPEYKQFNLASAEWLRHHNLLETNNAYPAQKKFTPATLKKIMANPAYVYEPKTGQLSLTYDSLHLTMGSVTKGYGINQLTELMLSNGIGDFLINAGGDLSFLGSNKSSKPWRIGVRHPRHPDSLQAIVTPNDVSYKGLATSGDYETFRLEKGKRMHHLINALTGEPISDKQSVTVLAKDPMEADFYATFLFLLPLDTLLNYVNHHNFLEVLVTDSLGALHYSQGMPPFLQQ